METILDNSANTAKYIIGTIEEDYFIKNTYDDEWESNQPVQSTLYKYNSGYSWIPLANFVKVKTNGGKSSSIEETSISTKEQSISIYLSEKIYNKLFFPIHWVQEGFNKPNIIAKENAFLVCQKIFKKYDLIPDKILASKEEGVYITYDAINMDENSSLIIETYNDNEIAIVVSDNKNKKIIYSEDIKELNFENAIRAFKKEII